jgi:hypothetical protein
MANEQRPGVLEVEVRDEAGQLAPARLHVEDLQGHPWQPSAEEIDAMDAAGEDRPLILYRDLRSSFGRWAVDQWCCRYLAAGRAALKLAAGAYRVFVHRGFETLPQSQTVEVRSGEVRRAAFPLRRLANLPEQGWYGGDVHVHIGRSDPADNPLWLQVLEAEDLHAVNTMSFKHGLDQVEMEQYAYGEPGKHQRGRYAIGAGTEFRDNDLYGHSTLAGLRERLDPVSVGRSLGLRENYPLFATVFEEARKQGGLAGWAHGGISGPLGGTNNFESLPVEAALGLVDFLEVVQYRQFLGYAFWYGLLNAGLRISAAGGSDFPFGIWLAPWHPSLGSDRTYALVGEEFSYRGWLEGLRRGNTFATSGPLLWVSVDGHRSGEEVCWRGEKHEAVLQARAQCIYPLECLEVIINGALVRRVEARGEGRVIEHEEAFVLEESSWLAVRCRGQARPEAFGGREAWDLQAHSSPIYLLQEGRPVCVPQDVTRLADYVRLMRFNYLRKGEFATEAQKEEMLRNCGRAIRFYESLLLR